MRFSSLLSLCAATLFSLSACTPPTKLTTENYNKLSIGMDYTEVTAILGEPTTCNNMMTAKNCTWGDTKRSINVSFVADKTIVFNAANLQ